MPEPVLVTGGAGFIGSHVVERLLGEGRHVHVLDDLSTGRLDNLRAVQSHPKGEAIDPRLGPVATIPHKIPEITGPISQMSVGTRHACVIVQEAYRCWGDGTNGQLGRALGG